MPRDTELTFSNKQALSVGSAADLAPTNSAGLIPINAPRNTHVPVAGFFAFVRIKNVGANAMTTGVFSAKLQRSQDGGSTWWTDDEIEMSIPAADLAVGDVAGRSVGVSFDSRFAQVDPTLLRFKLVYSTTGHTTASVVSLEATAYLTDKGAYTPLDG